MRRGAPPPAGLADCPPPVNSCLTPSGREGRGGPASGLAARPARVLGRWTVNVEGTWDVLRRALLLGSSTRAGERRRVAQLRRSTGGRRAAAARAARVRGAMCPFARWPVGAGTPPAVRQWGGCWGAQMQRRPVELVPSWLGPAKQGPAPVHSGRARRSPAQQPVALIRGPARVASWAAPGAAVGPHRGPVAAGSRRAPGRLIARRIAPIRHCETGPPLRGWSVAARVALPPPPSPIPLAVGH